MSGENGAGSNGDIPAKPPGRRLSGFAREGYWDEPSDKDPNITRREAKSLWAKKAAEDGLIGGARPGAGRPRKNKSVAEVVTEEASKKADTIARELIQMATQNNSPAIKLGAIDRINKFEQDLEKNMRDDEKELRKLSGQSLDDKLDELLGRFDYTVSPGDVEEITDGN